LEGANSGLSSGVQGRSPGRGSGARSPPEADDFSQLKGYLDVTFGMLGGHGPLAPPPLKSASGLLLYVSNGRKTGGSVYHLRHQEA